MPSANHSLLEAALTGYLQKRTELDRRIAEIRAELKVGTTPRSLAPADRPKVRSAAARKRMAAAQKRRWAAYRKEKGAQKQADPGQG